MKTQLEIIKPEFLTEAEVNHKLPLENAVTANAMLEKVDFNIIGHFGNIPAFYARVKLAGGMMQLGGGVNNISNAGIIMQALVELLDAQEDDGVFLSDIKDLPIRVVFKGGLLGKAVAVGNYLEDKFILLDDLYKLGVIVNG